MEFRESPAVERPERGHPFFYDFIEELYALHALKSGGYGTGADPFANFTAIASVTGRHRFEYPIERMIEKLTRCLSLIQQERFSELGEEFGDIAGLAGCAEAMRREDFGPADTGLTDAEAERKWKPVDDEELRKIEPVALAKRVVPANFLRLHGESEADRERRWRECGGEGLTD